MAWLLFLCYHKRKYWLVFKIYIQICFLLSYAREMLRDPEKRALCKLLHDLHRITFMGERTAYYKRKEAAKSEPLFYLSTISDGMQQAHCELPYQRNDVKFPGQISTHIQGILCHGRRLLLFRTFPNISNGNKIRKFLCVWQ